jgi:hypothetical protein
MVRIDVVPRDAFDRARRDYFFQAAPFVHANPNVRNVGVGGTRCPIQIRCVQRKIWTTAWARHAREGLVSP